MPTLLKNNLRLLQKLYEHRGIDIVFSTLYRHFCLVITSFENGINRFQFCFPGSRLIDLILTNSLKVLNFLTGFLFWSCSPVHFASYTINAINKSLWLDVNHKIWKLAIADSQNYVIPFVEMLILIRIPFMCHVKIKSSAEHVETLRNNCSA